ncbi:MAG: ABC transporter substrate-binding protein [Halobacteriaceae archaeon]
MKPDRNDTDDAPDALLMPNRRNMLSWLGVGGTAAVAGCSGDGGGGTTTAPTTGEPTSTTSGTPDVTGPFVNAYSSSASQINFIYNTEQGAADRINLTLDGAWAVTTENEVFPLWCEPTTQDNKTWTITLRDGLRWTDNGRMTAEDWVYMIQNIFQSKNNWTSYPNASDWQGVTVEQTGELTFDVTLPSADRNWPLRPVMWGQFCAPKEILQQYVQMHEDGDTEGALNGLKNDQDLNNLTYTGNLGPYTLDTWEQESQFVAARNDDYYMQDAEGVSPLWQNAPYYEKYNYRVVPEQSSRLNALKNGEAHRTSLPPERAQEFIDLSDVDVYVQPQPFVRPVIFNQRANGWSGFRKKKVRQGLMMTLDKSAFAQQIFRGYAEPAFTMQPKWSQWYSGEYVKTYGSGDLLDTEKARNRISSGLSGTEFGYDGETLVDGDGNQVNLTIYSQAGQPSEQTTAELIKQRFAMVGIAVTHDTLPVQTFFTDYYYNSVPQDKADQVPDDWPGDPTTPGPNSGPRDLSTSKEPWDMLLFFEYNTYPRTPADSKVFFYPRGSANFYGYVPSEGVSIKKMYEEAANATDEQTRQQLFAETFGTISTEQPFGFLVMEDDILGVQAGVDGPVEKFGSGWNSQTFHRT